MMNICDCFGIYFRFLFEGMSNVFETGSAQPIQPVGPSIDGMDFPVQSGT